jgi:hypothetical protein
MSLIKILFILFKMLRFDGWFMSGLFLLAKKLFEFIKKLIGMKLKGR